MYRQWILILIACLVGMHISAQRIERKTTADNTSSIGRERLREIYPDERMFILAKDQKTKSHKNAPINDCGNYAYTPQMLAQQEQTGTFIVNYTGFSPEAEAAFQHAVDIWSRLITTTIPIEIDADFSPLGAGILGAAGPTYIDRDFAGAPMSGTYYPIAVSDQYVGTDQLGADVSATFSSTFSDWYFGLDACPPLGQYDFVTVVLHEIAHGLGVFGSSDAFYYPFPPDQGFYGCYGVEDGGDYYPIIFDKFVEFPDGTPITTYDPFFCWTDLYDLFTGGELYFDSPSMTALLGDRARLYAPNPYLLGSSYSHLDEDTYDASSPHALMTPFIGAGEAIHDIGAVVGMFQDFG